MFEYLGDIVQNVFSIQSLLVLFAGSAVGMVVGTIPGLSASMGVALALPFTYGMGAAQGILLLVGIYCSAIYSGSISAILINTPGTSASTASLADGFSLTKQGKARKALDISLYASVFGGIFSGILLLLLAPQIAKAALTFGPPEYFALGILGLTIIAGVSSEGILKGLVLGAFGFLLSTIGIDPISGISRYTFGNSQLLAGIGTVAAMIGLFALSEMFNQVEIGSRKMVQVTTIDNDGMKIRETKRYVKTMSISSIIGSIIGAIPGTGSGIAAFLALRVAKGASKNPEEYGKGSLEALSATESAKNAVTGSAMIPMMTLGIPGDAVTAILLGGLTIQGLAPGPQLFEKNPVLVYTIMFGFILANFVMYLEAKVAIRGFSRISNIPNNVLIPIVSVCCIVGSFAINNNLFDVSVALVLGVFGFVLPKIGYSSLVPILIGLILGPLVEENFRRALVLSNGSYTIFVTRPISLVILLIAVGSVLVTVIKKKERR